MSSLNEYDSAVIALHVDAYKSLLLAEVCYQFAADFQNEPPYIERMSAGKTYTAEQLHRIYCVQVRICTLRGVALTSAEGTRIARRLLTEFSGSEAEDEMLSKFLS